MWMEQSGAVAPVLSGTEESLGVQSIAVSGNNSSCDRFSMWSGVFEALATVGYNPLDSSQGLS